MSEGRWPNGARGALCLSFDNLGEAAEIELGAAPGEARSGPHPTLTEGLPAILAALAAADLAATFFLEGLNAELYPDALGQIASQGHEVAFHAWRHEEWAALLPGEQAENLSRGLSAFTGLGLSVTGMRPPGGGLGAEGLDVARAAGLRYCSPAGAGIGVERGVALLPFQWRHVDASCVLPALGAVREQIHASPAPLEPAEFLTFLGSELRRLAEEGGFLAIVLHPFMLGWFGEDRLAALLDRVAAAAQTGELWVAPAATIAAHLLADPGGSCAGVKLDSTSWS